MKNVSTPYPATARPFRVSGEPARIYGEAQRAETLRDEALARLAAITERLDRPSALKRLVGWVASKVAHKAEPQIEQPVATQLVAEPVQVKRAPKDPKWADLVVQRTPSDLSGRYSSEDLMFLAGLGAVLDTERQAAMGADDPTAEHPFVSANQ